MKDFAGKVAVVTGAASGIGLAMATRFAQEGMKVVLADIEEPALQASVSRLRQQEHDVLGVVTDVSSEASIEALRDKTLEAYGKVHILCNNAGVVAQGAAPDIYGGTEKDWQWGIGVNLWGAIRGVRIFLPIMLEHGEEGHVVNTSSTAGLVSGGNIYGVTKHAVVSLSEGLFHHLSRMGSNVHCSVLCPGIVQTNILASERNRPEDLLNNSTPSEPSSEALARTEQMKKVFESRGMPADELAGIVFDAIRQEQFWIIPDTDMDSSIRDRMESILNRTNPVPILNPFR